MVATDELNKCLECLTGVINLFKNKPGPPGAAELVEKAAVFGNRAIRELNSGRKEAVCPDPTVVGTPSSDDWKSDSSTAKRRGRAAREKKTVARRRSHPYMRKETASTLDDGFTWRKYGQKEIQSAKYPRSYYRCTHKHARGCQATRQAQRSENDPSLYHITYHGNHTCNEPTKHHNVDRQPRIISFESSKHTTAMDEPVLPALASPSSRPQLKQEASDQDVLSSMTQDVSSSWEFHLPDLPLPAVERSVRTTQNSDAGSEHGDVSSGFHPFRSLEMDFSETFDFPYLFGDSDVSSSDLFLSSF